MRRIKNIVIGGIETKVFNLILSTVILLTAVFMVISFYHSRMLSQLAKETNEKQEASLKDISDDVMGSVIDQSMTRDTRMEAYIADEMFQGVKNRVLMLSDYAGKLFEDPDHYPRVDCDEPDPKKNGEVLSQLILAKGVDGRNARLNDRIRLAGNLSDLMVSMFGTSAEINSCFIALPEGAFLVTDDRSASKFDKSGKLIEYDPRTRPWYKQAVKEKGLIFTDVETDAFTGDIGVVCAMPIYVDGRLEAVVGSDLFLTSMKDAVLGSNENGGFTCVINQNGHVVFSPKETGDFRVLPSSKAEDLRHSDNESLSAFVTDALKNETEVRLIKLDDGQWYAAGAPMETVGWTVVSLLSKKMAGQPGAMLQKETDRISKESTKIYMKKTRNSQQTAIVLLIGVTILTLIGALFLGKRIVKPLNTITSRISHLSGENLEFKMEDCFRTGDEIEELAECFANLSHKTVEYLETIKTVTAEKERIGTELALATDIQAAMLPHIFPAFPDRPEFDIYASMDPAKEVGGDFYDYYLIDDDHLCMVIADVSGKGVPAALYMMSSKIILQSYATIGESAGEILRRTNEALCSNNEAQMFVTVWLGILELSSGKLIAANAGHERPIIKYPDQPFTLYKDRHGFVIGGMEGLNYTEYEIQLTPGTKLFVYTDGVPEATNAEKEMFGAERLIEALNTQPDKSPEDILLNVRKAVDAFVDNAEQFDDLTMLCLEYHKGTVSLDTE